MFVIRLCDLEVFDIAFNVAAALFENPPARFVDFLHN